jgi:hypothetical protein
LARGFWLLRAAYFLYGRGRNYLTFIRAASPGVAAEIGNQLRELHQVGDSEDRSALPDGDRGIRHDDVRPLRRDGADSPGIDLQQEPLAVPVVPFTDAGELPPAERVERMRYAYKMRGSCRSVCTSDRVTRSSTPGGSICRARHSRASSTCW